MQSRVGVIVGSLRKGAYTRMLARALPELTPPSLQLVDIAIGELPLYNYDLETKTPPPAWTAFRTAVKACDAILFVTPEFNRSMPGALKNAMDVGSRPWGDSAWSGKPAGVISLTPGALVAIAREDLDFFAVHDAVGGAELVRPRSAIRGQFLDHLPHGVVTGPKISHDTFLLVMLLDAVEAAAVIAQPARLGLR